MITDMKPELAEDVESPDLIDWVDRYVGQGDHSNTLKSDPHDSDSDHGEHSESDHDTDMDDNDADDASPDSSKLLCDAVST
jgi:hypothetical protein